MKAILQPCYIIYEICIALPIILVATILTAITTIVGGILGNSDFWGYYPGMIWSRIICKVLLLPVSMSGLENIEKGKPYIVIPNHQSIFDIFLLYGYIGIKFKWMMKKELERIPLVGAACRKAGFIYIERGSKSGSRESMAETEKTLSRGMSMIIFPEGTRTADGKIGRFKKGAFLLSEELGIPLLPVTINGAYQVMSRHARLVTWHPLSFTVHKAIEPESTEGLTPVELNAKMRETAAHAASVIESALNQSKTL